MSEEVEIIVRGPTGCAKSALLGEIEILMQALKIPHRYADPKEAQQEKNLTGADWISELEMYKPSVVLVEMNKPGFSASSVQKAYEAGQQAFKEGKQVVDNPYLLGSAPPSWPEAYQWLVGFMATSLESLTEPKRE
jgi:hypothetical protein